MQVGFGVHAVRLGGHEQDRADGAAARDERNAHRRVHLDLLELVGELARSLDVGRRRVRRRVRNELGDAGADDVRNADGSVGDDRVRLEHRTNRVLLSAGVLHRAALDRAAWAHDVDNAPISEARDCESRQGTQRLVVVEGAGEHVARLDEEGDAPLHFELAAIQARVHDRERGTAAELLGEDEVGFLVSAPRLRPGERDRTEHLALRGERHRDRGVRIELRHELEVVLVDRRRPQRLGREVREADGSAECKRLRGRLTRAADRRVIAIQHVEELLLARIGGAHGDATQRPVLLDEVDDAPVREARDDEVGERRERRVVVEALGQQRAGLGEEAEGLFALSAALVRALTRDCSGDEVRDAPEEQDVVGAQGLERRGREDADRLLVAPDRRGGDHPVELGALLAERARDRRVAVDRDALVVGRPPVRDVRGEDVVGRLEDRHPVGFKPGGDRGDRVGDELRQPGPGERGPAELRDERLLAVAPAKLVSAHGLVTCHGRLPNGTRDGRTRLRLRYRARGMTTAGFLVLSAFLASAVEGVEALTIVLASGVARGWRSSLTGVGAAVVALAVIVAALGPALTVVPIDALRLVVGGLLLAFGLQWLRKAILRASGFKALHDEDEIFSRELAEAKTAAPLLRGGVDWYGFTLSFKGVLLEGLEVAFIVLTFGSAQGSIPLAALGAGVAIVLVAALGFAVRAPLAKISENTIKFVVGVLLTTFGIFWSTEGAGGSWPGDDAAIFGVLAFVLALSFGLVAILKRRKREMLVTAGARA